MELEKIVQVLIYIHAGLGGIALLAGAIALSVKKGFRTHRKSGIIFYYSMLISALISLSIAILPNHENPFLFSIGLFSIYFILMGKRSLSFKKQSFDLRIDKLISTLIIFIGLTMILYPLLLEKNLNIVLAVFGAAGMVFGLRDLRLFRDPAQLKEKWLKLHLGKMTGGYIAAVSAFLVVNQVLPGVWNWFVPSFFGSLLIAFWIRKVNSSKKLSKL